ncbi:hypothetical protein CHLNCDRAFT_140699 [Chlorella variabilis]|uniref:EF-hand domain-containing protein n=1 Tax=Chlorella variabilis TaxID=554065 RepID=E1Z602_CHLVA|nr:hypothetical protein CHLNCDRAFT_140699 [Chlorella variabilis]EFN58563.1 hypothetical protein CHLNCDRAFT_140699 [Chlorella variabilis]|eukprot:XP_005850665.1 hypothetical protein CHLNCDRAFT_140699 [Chlorella variabilis]
MGNTLGKRSFKRDNSLSRRSQASSSSARGLSRLSSGVSRLSARVGLRRQYVAASKAEAANSRHALEQRLAEIIMAKAAAADPSAPKVKFNRLLLRFGTLHEGFAASKRVFRELVGVEGGELSLEQLRPACASLGYHLDEATLHSIFAGADMDGSRTLNVHEFLATMAIVHSLRGPEDEELVDPQILATWRTAEEAFMSFASSRDGFIEKDELTGLMHESATDQVRHSANGSGGDPIRSIAQQRFEELDLNGSGRVSFLEFLFCLEGWVEDAEEEDE